MADKVVRKRATKKVATKTTVRKAPTRTKQSVVSERRNLALPIAGGVFVIILGISVAVGFSDGGQIDITETVAERMNTATPEEQAKMNSLPVQKARTAAPDGGLVPTSDVNPQTPTTPPPPPPETSSTTANATSSSAETVEITESDTSLLTNDDVATEVAEPTEVVGSADTEEASGVETQTDAAVEPDQTSTN